MPPYTVYVFKVSDQLIPLLTLTRPNKRQNLVAAARIRAMVQALAENGHALRRSMLSTGRSQRPHDHGAHDHVHSA